MKENNRDKVLNHIIRYFFLYSVFPYSFLYFRLLPPLIPFLPEEEGEERRMRVRKTRKRKRIKFLSSFLDSPQDVNIV